MKGFFMFKKKFIAGFVFLFSALQAHQEVQLDWISNGDLQQEETIFLKAFLNAYKDIPLDVLKVKDVTAFLQEAFNDERADFNNPEKEILWVVAKENNKAIGFATFEKTDNAGEVYIRQLAVDPAFQGGGVAKKMVMAILERLPEAKKLVVSTRKINIGACSFYKKLGFSETERPHDGLSPERYVGFEKDIQ